LWAQLLAREGVSVERPVELTGFVEEPDGVRADLRLPDGATSRVMARYIAGCDGAHSAVREALGEDFVGGTYDHLFYVADVRAHGPMMNGELHVALDTEDLFAVFPLADAPDGAAGTRDVGRARLIGTMPPEAEIGAGKKTLSFFPLPASRRARAGLRRDALYLVRPDGYVAWPDPDADPARLEAYLDRHGFRAR